MIEVYLMIFSGVCQRSKIHEYWGFDMVTLFHCIATLKGIDAAGCTSAGCDPVYPRAMSLKAAALYQMGRYEHALLNYHRADR